SVYARATHASHPGSTRNACVTPMNRRSLACSSPMSQRRLERKTELPGFTAVRDRNDAPHLSGPPIQFFVNFLEEPNALAQPLLLVPNSCGFFRCQRLLADDDQRERLVEAPQDLPQAKRVG